MANAVRARGLRDLRTATTHHVPAKPPRKGTSYLDLFALSMERQRLEQELAGIDRRRDRIFERLAEVQSAMDKLVNTVDILTFRHHTSSAVARQAGLYTPASLSTDYRLQRPQRRGEQPAHDQVCGQQGDHARP